MRDHIPDALITAFERQYDSSWNDPQLRKERLAMRYGWAAAMEAKPCLHQIQEPAPATAMDALREAEAALEVAMARILKADPGHSIRVTSEAKALVAVRAALAAPAAVAVPDEREAFEKWVENPRLWSLAHQGAQWAAWQARAALAATPAAVDVVRYPTEADPATETLLVLNNSDKLIETPPAAPVVLPEPVATLEVTESADTLLLVRPCRVNTSGLHKLYTEQQVRALLATGGQAQADMPDSFREWFAQNYPADTIIVDPDWHAKSIFRMAQAHARLAAPQAQADARDAEIQQAVLAERERICAAIKAEDDHCVAEGDYMLDSDDCIKVARGEWVRPVYDAAIAAAKGE